MNSNAAASPNEPRRVTSVSNAIRILNLLAESEDGLGVTEISRSTGLSKSTVHTLLATLRADEFVAQSDDNSRYRLGLGAFEIGAAAVPGVPADGRLTPFLWALANETGEAVSLAIAHRGDAVIVQRIESSSLLRAEIRTGTRMPLHSSASGKALLSHMPEDLVYTLYPEVHLPEVSERTVRSREQLMAEIESARTLGYAINMDEFVAGVTGIAMCVPSTSRRSPLAVSIAGPSHRFDPQEWVERLQQAAQEMGKVID